MYLKQAVIVLCLAALALRTSVATAEEEAVQETARFSIIDEFEKLTSGTKSLFSDMNALRNSPVMQSLLSRLMQRGSYMTQLPVEKKQNANKSPVVQRVENVQNVVAVKPVGATQGPIVAGNTKSSIADKTKVADDPSKYFKIGDITIAGAMGLGALALGALIASPVVGAGILSRSDDDPNIAGKKSWLDSLAFWKEDKDGANFYKVPVVANKGQEQYYNPYHDLGDGTGYDPSIIKYEDDEDFYGDYNDDGTRVDKGSRKKSYYANYAAEGSRQDKTKKKKTYYSDEAFWNDHYFKDGVIYERGSNLASPYSYQRGVAGYGYYDYKKKGDKKPYARNSHYDYSDYGSASEGSYHVNDGYSIRDHGDRYYEEEDKDTVYVTVNEINKIANESLKDLLKQYQNYLKRVDGANVVYADIGAQEYAVGSSKDRSPVPLQVGGGGGSDWQPLEMYGDYNNWDTGYDNLKNHRIPSSEPFEENVYSEPLTQPANKPKQRIRRPQTPKIDPSQPAYEYHRSSNKERLIYEAPQVEATKAPDVAAAAPRRKLTRKTKAPEVEVTTLKTRITRESNISDTPNEKESFPADILVKELTDYQKAYARRFGSR